MKSGEVRALAVDESAKEEFPEAAIFEELGYEISVGGTGGLVAPKGIPADIVKKLHDSFKKAMDDPRYELTCKKLGIFKKYASSEDFFKMTKKLYEVNGVILKDLGLAKSK